MSNAGPSKHRAVFALLVDRSSYEAVSVSDATPQPGHDGHDRTRDAQDAHGNPNPWHAECVHGRWLVRRDDEWTCALRITPTKRGDKADRARAESVAETLNRLSR
jgi:hypothetical protein